MVGREIQVALIGVLVLGCSSFPAEKTFSGSYETDELGEFHVVMDFEHADMPVVLDADSVAQIALIVTREWIADPDLAAPPRVRTCLESSYVIVASDKTTTDLCNGSQYAGCSYSSRNFRASERVNSPAPQVIVLHEDTYSDCSDTTFLISHEFIHNMVRCLRGDSVRQLGDSDHSREGLWWINDGEESIEWRAGLAALREINSSTCGFPVD